MTAPLAPFQRHGRFDVAWAATDDLSGVANYAVVGRSDGGSGSSSVWSPWFDGMDSGAAFQGTPGTTYCFAVTATDGVGNVSARSRDRCTAVPLDDSSLSGAGWTHGFELGAYRGTFLVTDRRGAELTGPRVEASRVALVATACASCGAVEVRWNHEILGRVDLSSHGFHPGRIFPLAPFRHLRFGRVHLVVVTDGLRVEIDGLGVLAA